MQQVQQRQRPVSARGYVVVVVVVVVMMVMVVVVLVVAGEYTGTANCNKPSFRGTRVAAVVWDSLSRRNDASRCVAARTYLPQREPRETTLCPLQNAAARLLGSARSTRGSFREE